MSGIYVKNCTIYDTDNGVRIKTWPALHGGSVSNIQFEDIVMQNVSNPIIIDQMYCPHNECNRKVTFQFLFFHHKKENLYIWARYNCAKIL